MIVDGPQCPGDNESNNVVTCRAGEQGGDCAKLGKEAESEMGVVSYASD